jgi:hypothetical protein
LPVFATEVHRAGSSDRKRGEALPGALPAGERAVVELADFVGQAGDEIVVERRVVVLEQRKRLPVAGQPSDERVAGIGRGGGASDGQRPSRRQ